MTRTFAYGDYGSAVPAVDSPAFFGKNRQKHYMSPESRAAMVTLLADQLGAELAIERSNPTRFALRFKVAS